MSLKEGFARLDGRLTGVEKQIIGIEKQVIGIEKQVAMVANLLYVLIALIVLVVGIPQLIIAWRSRQDRASEKQITSLIQKQNEMISSLTEEVETLRVKVFHYFND